MDAVIITRGSSKWQGTMLAKGSFTEFVGVVWTRQTRLTRKSWRGPSSQQQSAASSGEKLEIRTMMPNSNCEQKGVNPTKEVPVLFAP
jgi:hypothetical protein